MGYSFHTVKDQVVYDIRLHRDIDQISMREVQLRPTSEEVDDYIEYKRIREKRQVHFKDDDEDKPPSPTPDPQPIQHDHLDSAKPMHSPSYRAVRPILPPSTSKPSPLGQVDLPATPENPSSPRRVNVPRTMASLTSILAPARAQETEFDTPGADTPDLSLSYMKQTRAYDGTHDQPDSSDSDPEKQSSTRDADTLSTSTSSISPKSRPRHIPMRTRSNAQVEKANVIESISSNNPEVHFVHMPLRNDPYDKKDSGVSMMSSDDDHKPRQPPGPSQLVAKVLEKASIDTLSLHLDELNIVTMRRGSMGPAFYEDMFHIQHTLEELRVNAEGKTRKDSLEFLETIEHDIESVREKIRVRGSILEETSASPLGEQCLEWEERYSLDRKD